MRSLAAVTLSMSTLQEGQLLLERIREVGLLCDLHVELCKNS